MRAFCVFSIAGSKSSNGVIDLEQYITMLQSESNLGVARFILPLKWRGSSATRDPDSTKLLLSGSQLLIASCDSSFY